MFTRSTYMPISDVNCTIFLYVTILFLNTFLKKIIFIRDNTFFHTYIMYFSSLFFVFKWMNIYITVLFLPINKKFKNKHKIVQGPKSKSFRRLLHHSLNVQSLKNLN